jgi:GTPase SAR1 family protein
MAPTPQSRSQELINVKLLLIGNSSVGKSSLLLRFSDKQWLPEDEASATIGVDFRVSARNLPLVSLFSSSFIDVGIRVCVTVVLCVVGILLYQVHKLEVQGRKVKMSIWVRRCAFLSFSSERTQTLRWLFFAPFL